MDVIGPDGKTSKGKFCELTCALDDRRCEGAPGYDYVMTKVRFLSPLPVLVPLFPFHGICPEFRP
jgi:hypothetical protein